jgi:hypothetical protein
VANPDQWPTIKPYYDLARAGTRPHVIVHWYAREAPKGIHAHGRVEAYDTLAGLVFGLRGLLDQPMQPIEEHHPFVPIELETATISVRAAHAFSTSAKVTAPSLGATQTLDDPIGGPSTSYGLGWNSRVTQAWPPKLGSDGGVLVPAVGVDIYLISLWLRPLDPGLFERVQDFLAGEK